MEHKKNKVIRETVRIGGFLKEIVVVADESGKVIHKVMRPLMVEFHFRDLVQVVIGSTLLSIPVGLTEEVWQLGRELSDFQIFIFFLISLFFIALFVYQNFYRNHFQEHWLEFFKRIFSIYIISFLVAALFLTIITKAPWSSDMILAVKRAVIVAFPASISAAVVDVLK